MNCSFAVLNIHSIVTNPKSIAVSIFYWIIAACIAELASAIPSTAGVYHWASVTPGKRYGRLVGYYAGYWNYFGWVFGSSSACVIVGNISVQLYVVSHPEFVSKPWHVFVAFIAMTWLGCLSVCYANKFMPYVNTLGSFFVITGVFITVVVCAAMPGHGGRPGHASSEFVWKDWVADLGYPDGFVFLAGMLNGAYAVGTPDLVCHLAEEIPRPHANIPKAVGITMGVGFITAFVYLIAILYSVHDLDALAESPFPIAEIYAQATNSRAGTTGLLILLLLPMVVGCIGLNITIGRGLWTLARDGATPFSGFLSKISPARGMPFNATIACAILNTILGCIYLGSKTAFNALVGSFVILTTASYTAAILPNLLTGRKNIVFGPFHMKGWLGFLMNAIACTYMVVFLVVFSFPYFLPASAQTMNYSSLIFGGLTIFVTGWYFLGGRKGYTGPEAIGGKVHEADMIRKLSEIVSKSKA